MSSPLTSYLCRLNSYVGIASFTFPVSSFTTLTIYCQPLAFQKPSFHILISELKTNSDDYLLYMVILENTSSYLATGKPILVITLEPNSVLSTINYDNCHQKLLK